MRGSLFRRFFLRFVSGLAVALLVLVGLVHLFQLRVVDAEWREELRQEAHWLALHFSATDAEQLAGAWRTMHDAVRITLFDADGRVVGDSHPERAPIDLAALRRGDALAGELAVVEERAGGSCLVMSRPYVPAFPSGMLPELGVAVLLMLGPMVVLLHPFVRSISGTLRDLGRMARDVSTGSFGRTLPVTRSDELGELVESFNEMSLELAESERLSARLLHDVSHELRSPLGRIQVQAETIEERPEETRQCVRGIAQDVRLLDRLVEDLLQTARLEADGLASRHEAFSLVRWATGLLERLERSARAQGVAWEVHLPDDDVEVRGDPERLSLALSNLVDNALRALRGRTAGRVRVDVEAGADSWSVRVEDDGPGIAPEHLPHLFRRFYRADEHRDRGSGGVGLGLALVRAIAQAHGGEAAIESRVGEGTRATLTLPLRRTQRPPDR